MTTARKKVDRLTMPRYGFAEADHLAGVARGTSRRWLVGYAYLGPEGRRVARPPVTAGAKEQEAVSFLDIVEIVAIGRLKGFGFSLGQIRQIVSNCQDLLRVARPLTSLKFKTDGREIFAQKGEVLLEVGRKKGMQAWSEVLEPYLQDLDYSSGVASRWWPLGKHKPIVVDPDYGHGLPVVANSGVRTEIVLERFQAGDLEIQIAKDFNLDPVEVERALQFELTRAA